jgi:4-amino-4-deoxychorismate lyase
MSLLLESIRIADGKVGNLAAHQYRVEQSCRQLFLKEVKWRIENIVEPGKLPDAGIHKLRIIYNAEHVEWSISAYTIKPVGTLKLVAADNIEYQHKFADRANLDELYARRTEKDDILIIRDGMVTDTSYANIVFSKKDKWYTPVTCLLNGTMRQYLIKRGVVEAIPITAQDVWNFDQFRLINAMLRMDAPASDVSNIS